MDDSSIKKAIQKNLSPLDEFGIFGRTTRRFPGPGHPTVNMIRRKKSQKKRKKESNKKY
jgi:hypothetical protein